MQTLPSSVLNESSYTVPTVSRAERGLGWLRASVPRFVDGPEHAERRQLVEQVIIDIGLPPAADTPTGALLAALNLSPSLEPLVALVAACYQPHLDVTPDADAAADQLVHACGGRTARSAATVCVLVQAHAATNALVDQLRSGTDGPPVPTTQRIDPRGQRVRVDLAAAPFGQGPHRCPGEALAVHLARQVAL